MRTLLAKSALLLSAIVLVAGCSSGDSGNKNTKPGGQIGGAGNGGNGGKTGGSTPATGPVGDVQNPHGTTLNMTAWCSNVSEEGSNYQFRVKLETNGSFNQSVYLLDWKGARSQKIGETNGTWSRNGNQVTITADGNTETVPMLLEEPSPVTGAPRLTIGNQGEETILDPCE